MKKYLIVGAIVLVLLAAGGYYWFRSSSAPSYTTAMVRRGAITQEVLASGNVASPTTIDLQFQNSGKLTFVGVQIGDSVKAGEVIARQDTSVLNAQLQQAQSAVSAQMASLTSLQQGTRPEQIAVTQSQVTSDEIALTQTDQSMINAIQSAYTASDDAVHNKIDQFVNNPRSTSPSLLFSSSNSQISNSALNERVSIEGV